MLHFSPIAPGLGKMMLVLTGLMSFVYVQYRLVKLHSQESNPISDSNRRLYNFGLTVGSITLVLVMVAIITEKFILVYNVYTPVHTFESPYLKTLELLTLFVPYFVSGILIPVITIVYTPRMKSFMLKKRLNLFCPAPTHCMPPTPLSLSRRSSLYRIQP